MTRRELAERVMALPLEDRVDLAEPLWRSIGDGFPAADEPVAIADATRRDAEPTSVAIVGRSH